MLVVDFIGLLMTICLTGLRYPHIVLAAGLIHDFGRILMVLFMSGNMESLVAAGVFGTATVTGFTNPINHALVVMAGPLACYLGCAVSGGIDREPTASLIHPCRALKAPVAVIMLRIAIVSFLINIWQFM